MWYIKKYIYQFITIQSVKVQSNQKMHDLYATKHISQMALPDAFWAV